MKTASKGGPTQGSFLSTSAPQGPAAPNSTRPTTTSEPGESRETHHSSLITHHSPLAARMRPRTLDEFVGQRHVLAPGKPLRRAIEEDRLGSIILWGPPGTGKTTLALLIARTTRARFASLSAVTAGVAELRKVIEEAKQRRRAGQKT